jgi:hypothetical protein
VRRARVLLLLGGAFGCSEQGGPAPSPTAASPPPPSASVQTAPVPGASVMVAEPPDGGGPLMIRREGGLVVAARAERVLHVGDSMAPLVGNYLRPMFSGERRYYVQSVPSTSTFDWGSKRLLQEAMYKYDPDLVLISLGSNELFDPNPERRAGAIRQIVEDTRGRPCLWIGPPLWKKDTGFLRVLEANLGHCRYFDSTSLRLPRMEDGRHPSWTGGYAWASAVWRALGGTEPVPTTTPLSVEPN